MFHKFLGLFRRRNNISNQKAERRKTETQNKTPEDNSHKNVSAIQRIKSRLARAARFVVEKLTRKKDESKSFTEVLGQEKNEIIESRASRMAKAMAMVVGTGEGGAQSVPIATDQVLKEEDEERKLRLGPAVENDLVGLCFSGGGIRSATFNLGILYGLAKRNYLTQIDYLSTVSGGGYIGSWLTAWIKREGCKKVEGTLKDPPKSQEQPERYLEPDPVRFLRKYSNYLAPRTGLVSTDLWALLAVYLRNVLLNLTLLVAAGALAIALPLVSMSYGGEIATEPGSLNNKAFWSAIVLLLLAMAAVAYSFASFSRDVRARFSAARRPGIYVCLPLLGAAVCLTYVLMWGGQRSGPGWFLKSVERLFSGVREHEVSQWAIEGAVWYALIWCAGNAIAGFIELFAHWEWNRKAFSALNWKVLFGYGGGPNPVVQNPWISVPVALAAALLSGALGGVLLYTVRLILLHAPATLWNELVLQPLADQVYVHIALRTILGPPLLLLTVVLVSVLHVGLLGRTFPDAKREWLARLCAMLSMTAVAWFIVMLLAIYGAVAFRFLFASAWATTAWGRVIKTLVASGWIGTSLAGLIGANNAKSKPQSSGAPTGLILKLAPPVFMIGLLLLLAYGVDAYLRGNPVPNGAGQQSTVSAEDYRQMLDNTASAGKVGEFAQRFTKLIAAATPASARRELANVLQDHWLYATNYLNWDSKKLLYLLIMLFVVVRLLSWRLDVNEFSIHLLYRNRLTRCYLGASRTERSPQPFTGFDVDDDLPLAALRMKYDLEDSNANPDLRKPYDGPYPLICTALNLVSGKDLAWQTRKARSFIYSPLYCGYDYYAGSEEVASALCKDAFRNTLSFSGEKGPYLGTAMAISGAAATPNMGYHSSPALTFLMGIFNVRLGWWAGNPRHKRAWRLSGPRSALYLGLELLGRTNDENRFVYLSDGGHFENLGLYELVHRKCRHIIVCDASCDPEYSFSDLGNAIAKCRRDLGAEITIDVSNLRPKKGERLSKAHFALGTIKYGQPGPYGELLYIKTSLCPHDRQDVQSFASEDRAFPHDTTADQFFNETRFESYRALGEDAFNNVVTAVTAKGKAEPSTLANLFGALQAHADEVRIRQGAFEIEEVEFEKMKFTFEAQ